MKNIIFIFLFVTACTPKTVIVNTPIKANKANFEKKETEYLFFESGNWISSEPDEIPETESNLDFFRAMYRNIKYPAMARENGVQGIVYITIIQDETGQVTESEIKSDIGSDCGSSALNALRFAASKKRLVPIFKDGIPRKVKYDSPVSFRLE